MPDIDFIKATLLVNFCAKVLNRILRLREKFTDTPLQCQTCQNKPGAPAVLNKYLEKFYGISEALHLNSINCTNAVIYNVS
ncbi:hypothetical protein F0145_15590 [Adhaeribacter rhizoryzae]|uniref:Uncharacterized protein n=1 Tax=Adhaeribacter rhizoryzae TaxID=2607907 RepID=A0A5M6D922_9BACT|nr:hypothetical protein F0145_15590 [Adhaeribacter rhizoryzae]